MKNLNTFIYERLKINKDSKLKKNELLYCPANYSDLFELMCDKVKEAKYKNLKVLDLNDIDVSKIDNFINLFYKLNIRLDIAPFDEIKIDEWDVSRVISFEKMFNGCDGIKKIDISKWNVESCRNMNAMFNNCEDLESVGDLGKWNTENLEVTELMFSNCPKLKDVGNLNNWNVDKLHHASLMFSDCHSLTNVGDISNWKLITMRNMIYMFEECKSLKKVGDLNKWQPYIDDLIRREGRSALNGFSRGAKFKKPKWDKI